MAGDLSGVRILILEDNDDERELARIVFEQQGAIVETVSNVADGLGVFAQKAPDVVVCDILLGNGALTGDVFVRSVARAAHDPGARVPIVAVTGNLHDVSKERLLAAGFDVVCAKPCAPQDLVNIVAGVTGRCSKAH